MNWKRGLLRFWAVLSLVWVALILVITFGMTGSGNFKSGDYQLVEELLTDPANLSPDGPTQMELARPGHGKWPVQFAEIDYSNLHRWKDDPNYQADVMPDGSTLYVRNSLLKEDQDFVLSKFWDQRYQRYLPKLMPFFLLMVAPPLATLILGAALAWSLRGFARDRKAT